jgi:uncharacterized protein
MENHKMKPSEALRVHRKDILRIIHHFHGKNVRLFGSVLHGKDMDHSDLDLLVDTTHEATLLDIASMRYELKLLLCVHVDVYTPYGLPQKFRESVLKEAKFI